MLTELASIQFWRSNELETQMVGWLSQVECQQQSVI